MKRSSRLTQVPCEEKKRYVVEHTILSFYFMTKKKHAQNDRILSRNLFLTKKWQNFCQKQNVFFVSDKNYTHTNEIKKLEQNNSTYDKSKFQIDDKVRIELQGFQKKNRRQIFKWNL